MSSYIHCPCCPDDHKIRKVNVKKDGLIHSFDAVKCPTAGMLYRHTWTVEDKPFGAVLSSCLIGGQWLPKADALYTLA